MPCRYGRRYGATAPSLFRRGRRGGQPDARGREKAAHGAAFAEPPNPRSRIRGRRPADEPQRARHRIDRRRAGLSRPCPAGADAGRGSRGSGAASRATRKPTFAIGFQTGQEMDWLPRATSILRDELPNIEIRVSSDHSTMLADDLQRGKLDIAFLRREQKPDLEYKLVAKEPLVVILPSDHPLAEREAIDPHDLVGETFIGVSEHPARAACCYRRLSETIWDRDHAASRDR